MAFVHFDNMNQICYDRKAPVKEYPRLDILIPSDPVTETLMTSSNRWWETIRKDLLIEKERELSLLLT